MRELENILERACALCDNGTIRPEDLGLTLRYQQPAPLPKTAIGDAFDLESELTQIERSFIRQMLEATGWNRTEAAKRLGLTLRSLRYRMQKLGLEAPDK